MKTKGRNRFETATRLFRKRGGILRTKEVLRLGIHPRTLYQMRDEGVLERLSPGLYRLAELPPLGNIDLIIVGRKVPKGIICLISALAFHDLTSQIPHQVYLALARGSESPRLPHPPIRVFWFSGLAFTEGVEMHEIDGVPVPIYSPEKTLADCFKYRNKIGLDTTLEALKRYFTTHRLRVDDLLRFARICRVETIMRPYLESCL